MALKLLLAHSSIFDANFFLSFLYFLLFMPSLCYIDLVHVRTFTSTPRNKSVTFFLDESLRKPSCLYTAKTHIHQQRPWAFGLFGLFGSVFSVFQEFGLPELKTKIISVFSVFHYWVFGLYYSVFGPDQIDQINLLQLIFMLLPVPIHVYI